MRINGQGYLEVRGSKNTWRNFWIIKHLGKDFRRSARLTFGCISFPEKYAGKKVRFKMEVVEE